MPMQSRSAVVLAALVVGGLGWAAYTMSRSGGPVARPNILVVILDDVGPDKLAPWAGPGDLPMTPTIDALAAARVRFERAYAWPTCSPSRAAIQTGRSPWRTGIGHALPPSGHTPLAAAEITLPELLAAQAPESWSSSFVGKWHLATRQGGGFHRHPNDQGYGWFGGVMVGVSAAHLARDRRPQNYFNWEKTENGETRRSRTYHTTEVADDAIARMQVMPEPWLLVVSFLAGHSPYHRPPAHLLPERPTAGTGRTRSYHGMIEAMDHELGRVLVAAERAPRGTHVLLLSDNGTPSDVRAVPENAKGSVHEGGTRVPLIVAGPSVRPGVSRALVQVSDVYATVAELAGIDTLIGGEDSVSLLPAVRSPGDHGARDAVFLEAFRNREGASGDTLHEYAVVESSWALIRSREGVLALHPLDASGREGEDVLESGEAAPEVEEVVERLLARVPDVFRGEP